MSLADEPARPYVMGRKYDVFVGGADATLQRRFGGASRDRTDDLIVANDALSQLSYSPIRWWVYVE